MDRTRGGRAELAALQIADPASAWAALGFAVDRDGVTVVGGVEIWLDPVGRGITGWTLRRTARTGDVDGLPTGITNDPPALANADHPNGAMGVDQVVVTTPDFDRTAAVLNDFGMPLRRVLDAGGLRQGFRRLGPAILELVETSAAADVSATTDGPAGVAGPAGKRAAGPADPPGPSAPTDGAGPENPPGRSAPTDGAGPADPAGPARFWGLVVVVPDLDRLAELLHPHLGEIRPAVQPGRHIATLGESAGLSTRMAFMDPEGSA